MVESRIDEFEAYRSLLFGIAYRMLGSAAEAEDLVQDAWLRFSAADGEPVRDVKAFLVTMLTRLALDRLKSAQHQRETYVGTWLPEPVLTGDGDAGDRVARGQAIELALLAALERLTPAERATLLLYEVLEYDHNEIAEMLDTTPAASRQLLHRARERVADKRRRFTPSPEVQRRLVDGFLRAVSEGDVEGLRALLADDVVAHGDGGGKATAGRKDLVGSDVVARFFIGISKKAPAGATFYIEEINNALGLLVFANGTLYDVTSFAFDGDRIAEITSVLNPEKLRWVRARVNG
jgi:RNA polymerase sigma-70 factor (ECF subfamily)